MGPKSSPEQAGGSNAGPQAGRLDIHRTQGASAIFRQEMRLP